MATQLVKDKLALLPTNPGCYLMKDKDGTIIYVGKAKNLKNRVRSYFVGSHNAKTTLLVSEICDFEYVITSSELESLILEINLIKNHLPKYNIRLVDDASYPYILITKEKYPRLLVVREALNKKRGVFFGPYPSVSSARETAQLLNRVYPFRKCNHIPLKECIYYHMHQCLGPCIHKDDLNYEKFVTEASEFLKGNNKNILKELEDKMLSSSQNLDFEKALEYKNLMEDIKATTQKQKIVSNDLLSRDVIGVYHNNEDISIQILYLRQGAIVQNYRTIIPVVGEINDTLMEFLLQFYQNNSLRPKEILINDIIDSSILSSALEMDILVPQKGLKKQLVDMALKNAEENYNKNKVLYINRAIKNQNNIDRLGELLNIKTPNIIEAFDNSNLFGEYPVSAMVCYKNGVKSPSDYRKYHVKTVQGANDYATMKEIIYRRYYRLLMEDSTLPDLIIMDGGEIQVNACLEELDKLNLTIPVIGLKKDDNHQTNVIIYQGRTIQLSKNDSLYLFLANIQQTVHDFAISFFRNTKTKGLFISRLDGIKGLGPKKKERLLKEYITIDKIKTLSFDEFKKVGINEELAQKILDQLNKNDDSN